MYKKKLNVRAVALAAMLALSSAAMAAAPQGPGTVTLTNSIGNVWTASIGDSPALGNFTDVFTFTPSAPSGSWATGTVINTSFYGFGEINFTAADMNGNALITGALPPVGPFQINGAVLLPTYVSGPLVLTISGVNSGGGSYGGDVEVHMAPVPEPETYAMLIGGLGILAMLARRRKQE